MRTSDVLANARKRPLAEGEALHLLSVQDGGLSFCEDLFAVASDVRREHKGNEFTLDGFLSTLSDCAIRPACHYCSRASGADFPPPLTPDEVTEGARFIASSGTKVMEVGGGTNPAQAERIIECAHAAIEASGIRVWVNVGPSFARRHLERLKDVGIEMVGANLETINPDVFRRVKPGDGLEKRMRLAKEIKSVGLKLSSVMMVGIGSSVADYARHIFWLKEVGVDRMSVTGLNPVPGTPLEAAEPASPFDVCRVAAVGRLVLRDADVSVGGMMNDPRLLPLQVMSGVNRSNHLGAAVHRRRPAGGFQRWPRTIQYKETDGILFSNLRPVSERFLRQLGMEPV